MCVLQQWPVFPYLFHPWRLRWYRASRVAESWRPCTSTHQGCRWEWWTHKRQSSRKFLNQLTTTCQLGQKRRFPNWGEADHPHSRVSRFGYFETLPRNSSLLAPCRVDELTLELGELGLKEAEMVRSSLVLLRPLHLSLDLCDLLSRWHPAKVDAN